MRHEFIVLVAEIKWIVGSGAWSIIPSWELSHIPYTLPYTAFEDDFPFPQVGYVS